MVWSQLKNIIILLLLILNLFFLYLVVSQEVEVKRYEESAQENVISILKKNGISISKEIVPWDVKLPLQQIERHDEKQSTRNLSFLGKTERKDSGALLEYIGERGTAQFLRTGEFLILMNAGLNAEGKTSAQHALDFLQQLGIDSEVVDLQTKQEETTVLLWQKMDGVPIFTCKIMVEYLDGMFFKASGWQLEGAAVYSSKQETLSVPTLLMQFLEKIKIIGDDCCEIRTITLGYTYNGGLASNITLTPTWYIETNAGTYTLNCINGTLECVVEP